MTLRESEARLRRAIEIETVGVIFFTLDGRITETNDAFLKMSGYTRDDVEEGRVRWDKMTPPEWMELTREEMDRRQPHRQNRPLREAIHPQGWHALVGTLHRDKTW